MTVSGSPVVFRIEVGEARPVTVERFQLGVRKVAATPGEFAPLVYDRSGADLDDRGLPPEQRDIVETAIREGYDERAPYSNAFEGLRGTLGGVGDSGDTVECANYDDEWFAVEFFEAVA